MAKKRLSILITFKDEEKWLYDEICRHSSKGGWVKDVLKDYLSGNLKSEDPPAKPLSIDSILGI